MLQCDDSEAEGLSRTRLNEGRSPDSRDLALDSPSHALHSGLRLRVLESNFSSTVAGAVPDLDWLPVSPIRSSLRSNSGMNWHLHLTRDSNEGFSHGQTNFVSWS